MSPKAIDAQSVKLDMESAVQSGTGSMATTREYARNVSSTSSRSGTNPNTQPQSARKQRALQMMMQWE